MKGYKVSDVYRTKTVGVACKSVSELINKGKTKLKIPKGTNVKVFLPDGTEVESEEYFQSLPNQTTLLLKQNHEYIPSGADLIYHALKLINIDLIRAGEEVQRFLDENMKEKVRTLAQLIDGKKSADESRTTLSNKSEDPDWFVGLETNATTKEDFMSRRSQDRIRGYFYKTKSDIKKSPSYCNDSNLRRVLDGVFENFASLLKKDNFFGCLFNRCANDSLCDKLGYFQCAGIWKNSRCLYNKGMRHEINPYSSREERIVFSTWNLDHNIERSRTIIPALMNAAELVVCKLKDEAEVNILYFYSLLFTSKNLRLVHIVCHDKGKHLTAQCDPHKIIVYLSSSKSQVTEETTRSSAISCSE